MPLLILHKDSNIVLRLTSKAPPVLAPGERAAHVRDGVDLATCPCRWTQGTLIPITLTPEELAALGIWLE